MEHKMNKDDLKDPNCRMEVNKQEGDLKEKIETILKPALDRLKERQIMGIVLVSFTMRDDGQPSIEIELVVDSSLNPVVFAMAAASELASSAMQHSGEISAIIEDENKNLGSPDNPESIFDRVGIVRGKGPQ